MIHRIPVDSSDARELREAEREQAQAEAAARACRAAADLAARAEHDQACTGGWVGEDDDGRPRPCPTCRPHLAHVRCWTCSVPWSVCEEASTTSRGGPCCGDCDHRPAAMRGA